MRRVESLAIRVLTIGIAFPGTCLVGQEVPKPIRAKMDDQATKVGERVAWPTFEPFEFARLVHRKSIDLKSKKFDAAAAVKQLRELVDGLKKVAKSNASEGTSDAVQKTLGWNLVPLFMIELGTIAEDLDWDADEIELAALATDHFKLLPSGIEVDLSNAENRAKGIDAIATWFQSQVKDPMRYGEMIFAFLESGPHIGTVADVPSNAKVVGTLRVTKELEVKLLDVEGSDRRIAAYRGQEMLWARTLRYFGDGAPLNQVQFNGSRPTSLGTYGYLIPMNYGENASLYLDPDGNFLFYFLSL